MNLRNLAIHLESDGFRIEDPGHEIPAGTLLIAHYELPAGWEEQQLEYYPKGWNILHPFTKAGMFVYTGQPPLRVAIRQATTGLLFAESSEEELSSANFSSYPPYNDEVWLDGYLPLILDRGTQADPTYQDETPAFQATTPEYVPGSGLESQGQQAGSTQGSGDIIAADGWPGSQLIDPPNDPSCGPSVTEGNRSEGNDAPADDYDPELVEPDMNDIQSNPDNPDKGDPNAY